MSNNNEKLERLSKDDQNKFWKIIDERVIDFKNILIWKNVYQITKFYNTEENFKKCVSNRKYLLEKYERNTGLNSNEYETLKLLNNTFNKAFSISRDQMLKLIPMLTIHSKETNKIILQTSVINMVYEMIKSTDENFMMIIKHFNSNVDGASRYSCQNRFLLGFEALDKAFKIKDEILKDFSDNTFLTRRQMKMIGKAFPKNEYNINQENNQNN